MGIFFQVVIKIYRKLYEAYANWCKDDAAGLAAATSYYMALSFFPLLLLILSLMGFLLRFTGWAIDAQQRLLTLLADNVAPSLASQVEVALSSVKTNAALSGPVGLITLLLAATAFGISPIENTREFSPPSVASFFKDFAPFSC